MYHSPSLSLSLPLFRLRFCALVRFMCVHAYVLEPTSKLSFKEGHFGIEAIGRVVATTVPTTT